MTRSQIYRELRDLAESGLVKAGPSGRRERVPFTVTAAGRRQFKEWLAQDPGPDLIRHRLLLTVFFADHLAPERLAEILDSRRAQHTERLAAYRELQRASPPGTSDLTLAFGVAYEEMLLAWLEEVSDSLPGRRRPPPRRSGRRGTAST